jgi:mono/diheme cytochrome c family protein
MLDTTLKPMRTLTRRGGIISCLAVAFALGVATQTNSPALAQMGDRLANDIELPLDNPAAVDAGRERFAALCALCHGAKGRGGGKGAPCLTCGRFRHGGKASELYAHIFGGVPGTLMGAFANTLSEQEILNVIAFLRVHTAERKASGELE